MTFDLGQDRMGTDSKDSSGDRMGGRAAWVDRVGRATATAAAFAQTIVIR